MLHNELRFAAYLYFNNIDVIDNKDGSSYKVNKEKMKQFLDDYGVIGWDSEKKNYITKVQG